MLINNLVGEEVVVHWEGHTVEGTLNFLGTKDDKVNYLVSYFGGFCKFTSKEVMRYYLKEGTHNIVLNPSLY